MTPNFLIIGCGKCGTTTLANLLNQHPQVFVVISPKEPRFFSLNRKYNKGWEWYLSLFQDAKGAVARGEKSVMYSEVTFEDRVCRRILKHIPDVRLIYIVRNPLERIRSAYLQNHHDAYHRCKYFPYSLEQALKYRPQILTNTLYWQRINKFRLFFRDEQILVLFLEDLKMNPRGVLKQCFNFLEVDPSFIPDNLYISKNTADEKYYNKWLMRLVLKQKILNCVWKRIPENIRRSVKPFMRNRFNEPVKWEPSAREFVLSQVAEDSGQFLKFYGKPTDFWGSDFMRKERGLDPGLGDENIDALRTA